MKLAKAAPNAGAVPAACACAACNCACAKSTKGSIACTEAVGKAAPSQPPASPHCPPSSPHWMPLNPASPHCPPKMSTCGASAWMPMAGPAAICSIGADGCCCWARGDPAPVNPPCKASKACKADGDGRVWATWSTMRCPHCTQKLVPPATKLPQLPQDRPACDDSMNCGAAGIGHIWPASGASQLAIADCIGLGVPTWCALQLSNAGGIGGDCGASHLSCIDSVGIALPTSIGGGGGSSCSGACTGCGAAKN
mmetsp:Transcript_101621/g.265309  ORF Transcript_101621/g.265309 Transcript_101621/m.265309 type:complete len:253 (-) Transcript_101621:305-1063(-)